MNWSILASHDRASLYGKIYAKLGLTLRDDIDFRQLGCALHAAGEGVMFRAMLPVRPGHATPIPPDLLTLLAKALVIATADWGDGKTLDVLLNKPVDKHREDTITVSQP